MRRVAGHVFTILSMLSLLLLVAVSFMWVRSMYVGDMVVRYGHGTVLVRSQDGLLFPHWTASDLGQPPGWEYKKWKPDPQRSAWTWLGGGRWAQLGFMHAVGQTSDNQSIHQLALPYYALLIATAVLPVAWSLRRVRQRSRPGCCPACGYDLRASPERCPECGAVADNQVAA